MVRSESLKLGMRVSLCECPGTLMGVNYADKLFLFYADEANRSRFHSSSSPSSCELDVDNTVGLDTEGRCWFITESYMDRIKILDENVEQEIW
jgi:hypothetical protein